jgi:hypothetical protein
MEVIPETRRVISTFFVICVPKIKDKSIIFSNYKTNIFTTANFILSSKERYTDIK